MNQDDHRLAGQERIFHRLHLIIWLSVGVFACVGVANTVSDLVFYRRVWSSERILKILEVGIIANRRAGTSANIFKKRATLFREDGRWALAIRLDNHGHRCWAAVGEFGLCAAVLADVIQLEHGAGSCLN